MLYLIDYLSKDPLKGRDKRNNLLSHEWRVREVSKKLHRFCDVYIPMRHYVSPNSKCVEFCDVKDVILKLCKAFGLDAVATQHAIDLAFTLDGANLTSKLLFVMASLKFVDISVKTLSQAPTNSIQTTLTHIYHRVGSGASHSNVVWEERANVCTRRNLQIDFSFLLMLVRRVRQCSLDGNQSILPTPPIWRQFRKC